MFGSCLCRSMGLMQYCLALQLVVQQNQHRETVSFRGFFQHGDRDGIVCQRDRCFRHCTPSQVLNVRETDSRVLALDVVALVLLQAVDGDGVGGRGGRGGGGVVGGCWGWSRGGGVGRM